MYSLRKIIGINLRYYRYLSGLSQEKYYEKFGLNYKYLASIERGEVNITVNFIEKLSTKLGIPILELVTFDKNKIIRQKRIDAKTKDHQ